VNDEEVWEVSLTVLVPKQDGLLSEDDVIDHVGDRLAPYFWTGSVKLLPAETEEP
jgi:hypothetical protein